MPRSLKKVPFVDELGDGFDAVPPYVQSAIVTLPLPFIFVKVNENVAVASKKMFKEGKTFEPNLNDKDIYDKNFEVYKKLQKLVV